MKSDTDTYSIDLPPGGCGFKELSRILETAVRLKASDVMVMGDEPIWMSIEGRKRLMSARRIKNTEITAMLNEAYSTGAAATLGSGRHIDFSHQLTVEGPEGRSMARFRVNAVSVVKKGRPENIATTWRLIPHTPPTIEALGVPEALVKATMELDQGMGLFVGGTGHGKSTLMASLIRHRVEAEEANEWVVTIEAPVEYVYDAIECPTSTVRQMEVGVNVESFHAGVVCSLRMAPTLILVGESRDSATVEATVESAMTGHGVFTTVHSSTAPGALRRMEMAFPEASRAQAKESLLQSVRFVVAQRLMHGSDGRRVAVQEYLEVDGALRARLRKAADWFAEATEALVGGGFGWPMIECAERLHREGRLNDEGLESCRQMHKAQVAGHA